MLLTLDSHHWGSFLILDDLGEYPLDINCNLHTYIYIHTWPPSNTVLKSRTSIMNTFTPTGQLHLHWSGAAGGRSERPGQSTAPTVEQPLVPGTWGEPMEEVIGGHGVDLIELQVSCWWAFKMRHAEKF